MPEPGEPTADPLSEPSTKAIVLAERGLPFDAVVRGVLGRFLPGSILSMAGLIGVLSMIGGPSLVEFLLLVGVPSVGLAVGYGGGLELLRRWLFPGASIDGRPSLVAGFVAPLALFIWVALFADSLAGFGWPLLAGALLLVGMGMAVMMFFPWLTTEEEG